MTGEIIVGAALVKTFEWIWKSFGDDIAKTSTKKALKVPWEKFSFRQAAKKYVEDMKRQYGIMHIWRMAKPVPLEGIFTHVNLLSDQSAFRHPSTYEMLEQLYLRKAKFGEVLGKLKAKRQDGLDVVRANNRLFILGKPGAGKTTFLKHLTLQAFEGGLEYVPIFIPLRQFSDTKFSLFEFITNQFRICDFPDAQSFIRKILRQGKALVLCDGLDEVNKDGGARSRVIQKLNDFSNEYDDSKCVITCRVAAAEYHFSGFTYVEMADFDEEQIRCFVTNWFRTTDNPYLAEDTTNEFLKTCCETRNERLLDLAKNPLLLTLLCLSYEETLTFADRRSEIYEEALDALLKKWDASRGIIRDEVYHTLSLGRKRQMFVRIAAETFEDTKYLVKQDYLEKKILTFFRTLPSVDQAEEIDAAAIIKAIEAQHGIFVECAQKLYSFSHLTFQEYFTARYIVEHLDKGTLEGLIRNHHTDDNWREVFLLTAEMLDEADKFFAIFLTLLDEMVQQEERLQRLLRKVEQESEIWDDEAEPYQKRLAKMRVILMTIFQLASAAANTTAVNAAYTAVNAANATTFLDDAIDDIALATATAAYAVAYATAYADAYARAITTTEAAIRISRQQGFPDLAIALEQVVLPSSDAPAEEWRNCASHLLEIFAAHFPIEDYELTSKEATHVARYLRTTTLLLDCLRTAAVADRRAIEERLLRVS